MDFTNLGNKTQTINLSKNTGTLSIDLTKRGKPLVEVYFGASWDPVMSGRSIDIDTSAIAVASDGKWHEASDVLFYNNLQNAYMEHSPDDLDGSSADGDDDDEFIKVNLVKAPDYIKEIILVANIFEADKRNQTFGSVRSVMRICEKDANGKELAKFRLSDDYATDTAVVLGKFTRVSGNWEFETIGGGSMELLGEILTKYAGERLVFK